ncbi:hypothetical protein AMS66_23245 [Paenibacillus xylanivorans]|uniref:Uncharacterized protein n=1 Tax=Paenibacillus xylanivorans TaxID=1705561 RepID=A0A0M9BM66_9BACL|nr:hypothetical protein AMS66_23245 [Paenibacillus xylanivorans]
MELEKRVGDSANWMWFRESDMENPLAYRVTIEDNRMTVQWNMTMQSKVPLLSLQLYFLSLIFYLNTRKKSFYNHCQYVIIQSPGGLPNKKVKYCN